MLSLLRVRLVTVIVMFRIVQDAHEWNTRRPDKKTDAAPAAVAPPAAAEAPVV
jgi:hypothetical protein